MGLKVLSLLFILCFSFIDVLFGGQIKISTYYPSPYAGYDELRLVPRSSTGIICDSSMEGMLYYDQSSDVIFVCKDDGSASWVNFEGIWEQVDNGTDGDVYLKSTGSVDLKVGIGTTTPEFRLTLDKGATTPDGGILAIGTFGSGADLVTAGAGTRFIWYPKKAALRAGYVDGAQWDDANIGDYSAAFGDSTTALGIASFAAGSHTTASGDYSFAAGNSTTASGIASFASGNNTTASGDYSFAAGNSTTASGTGAIASGSGTTASGAYSASFGYNTTASGDFSFASGYETEAEAYNCFVSGRYNIISGDSVNWIATDPLFVIGNGADDLNRHNALTLLKNGNLGINTSDVEFRLTLDKGESAPDGGILAIGTFGSGADLVTKGAGTRFIWYPKKAALRAGYVDGAQWDDANIGDYSAAFGNSTIASGTASFAAGEHTVASGEASFASGYNTTASGNSSFASGYNTIASGASSFASGKDTVASGEVSFASGEGTIASGDYSFAAGYHVTAQAYASVAFGRYNVVAGNSTSWVDSDPLFVIGDGSSDTSRHNAFTVLKNGNVGIGIATPQSKLQIDGYLQLRKVFSPPSGADCSADTAGRMISYGNNIYICNGSSWVSF